MSSLFHPSDPEPSFSKTGRSRYNAFENFSEDSTPASLLMRSRQKRKQEVLSEVSLVSETINETQGSGIDDYPGLVSTFSRPTRKDSFGTGLDNADSPFVGEYSAFSDFDKGRTTDALQDSPRRLLTPPIRTGAQYDFFDDTTDGEASVFRLRGNYYHNRTLSREESPHIFEKDSYTSMYPSNDKVYEDLFKWVWGVIYKNDGYIQVNYLADLLYTASKQWYEIIVTEFFGLHRFLQQYPLDFYISRDNGSYFVSLMPPESAQPKHPRSRTSRTAGIDRYDRHSPATGLSEQVREPSHFNNPMSPPQELSEETILQVVNYICDLLGNSPNGKLKAVELANRVRDTFGTELLSQIREEFMGLLSLLEGFQDYFIVTRIPKNDFVSLTPQTLEQYQSQDHSYRSTTFHSPTPYNPQSSRSPVYSSDERPKSRFDSYDYKGRYEGGYGSDGPRPIMSQGRKVQLGVTRCLHVGNVGVKTSEDNLRQEFGKFGEVEDVKIIHQGERRYAFVYFTTCEAAEAARNTLTKQARWKGNISFAKKEKDAAERKVKNVNPSRHLWLGNVNTQTVTTPELRRLFEPFGAIENINILFDKNCVFIDYFDESSAIAAQQQMKGLVLNGNIVELGFGKSEKAMVVMLTEEDRDMIETAFETVMSTLRCGEQITLTEAYNRIVATDAVKQQASMPPQIQMRREQIDEHNLNIVRGVTLGLSSSYVIQKDVETNQLYFSNNSLPVKSVQNDEICIGLLKLILMTNLQLVYWPKYQQRDMYLINLSKQVLSQKTEGATVFEIMKSIQKDLFYTNTPINVEALESFFNTYASIFTYKDKTVYFKQ